MVKLSDNLTLYDAIKSTTAAKYSIPNNPNDLQINAMILTANQIFEPLRKVFTDLKINSFFRSEALNKRLGGSKTSQHCTGQAMDLSCSDNAKLFSYINANMGFDQLIWEFGTEIQPDWVHVSFIGLKNRKSVLVSKLVNNKTVYEKYYS